MQQPTVSHYRKKIMTTATSQSYLFDSGKTDVSVSKDMGNRVVDSTDKNTMTGVFIDMYNVTKDDVMNVPMDVINRTEVPMQLNDVKNIRNSIAQVMSITLICTGVAIILINIFVIAIFVVHKWMKSNANIIICSMAITDLLAGADTITIGIVEWTEWFPNVHSLFCRLLDTVDAWIAMASLSHVLAVNAERYLAIVFPLQYKLLLQLGSSSSSLGFGL